jgi:hypothetical protein
MRVNTEYPPRIEASPVSEIMKTVQFKDKVTDEASADHPGLLTQTVISGLKLAVYGPAWNGVIPILRIFCVLRMMQSIGSTAG